MIAIVGLECQQQKQTGKKSAQFCQLDKPNTIVSQPVAETKVLNLLLQVA
jgi:hypothetical protein